MKNTWFALWICISLLFACQSQKTLDFDPVPDELTLTGVVINRDETAHQVIKVNYFDPFDESVKAVKVNPENGSFMIKRVIPFGTEINIEYYKYITFYAEPGDSIHITIDAEKVKKSSYETLYSGVIFTGDKKEINNVYGKAYYSTVDPNFPELYIPHHYSDTSDIYTYETHIINDLNILNQRLDNYNKEHNLPEFVFQLLKKDILYKISYFTGDYKENDETEKGYEDRNHIFNLPLWNTFDPANFECQMFYYTLSNYISTVIIGNKEVKNSLEEGNPQEAIKSAIRILNEYPAGFIQDYMIYYIAYNIIVAFDKTEIPLDEINKSIKSPFIKKELNKLISEKKPSGNYPFLPVSMIYLENDQNIPLEEDDFYEYLQKKHPDKVIYLDIWASWCGPCRREIPFAKELHNKLKNKDIVFVNLCLATPQNTWNKFIKDEDICGENYFMDSDYTKLFMSHTHIKSFPTYQIINKKGELINRKAGKPSQPETLEQISAYL